MEKAMKPLEKMAQELFHSFARIEGRVADWQYLSDERKRVWMQDTMIMAKYFMIQLQKEIKPMPNRKSQTSYEAGFVTGQKSERLAFQTLIEEIYNKLEQEYDNLQET